MLMEAIDFLCPCLIGCASLLSPHHSRGPTVKRDVAGRRGTWVIDQAHWDGLPDGHTRGHHH
jgi:hypothetical protein